MLLTKNSDNQKNTKINLAFEFAIKYLIAFRTMLCFRKGESKVNFSKILIIFKRL